MIQLPSKIRTTLFNVSLDDDPLQLFSHENDRLFVIIYTAYDATAFPAFGRSGQDVKNTDAFDTAFNSPIYFFGPEPLWVATSTRSGSPQHTMMIVHGVYRA